MELFWLTAGILLLGYSAYAYFFGGESWEEITITFYPALMALILTVFRYIARTNNQNDTKGE